MRRNRSTCDVQRATEIEVRRQMFFNLRWARGAFVVILFAFLFLTLPLFAETPKFYSLAYQYDAFLRRQDPETKRFFILGVTTSQNIVSIAFHDGPKPYTMHIVQTLIRLNCPATFFAIGDCLSLANSAQLKNPLFEVGIHCYTHTNYLSYKNPKKIEIDILKAKEKFSKLGFSPVYFCPPFGAVNLQVTHYLQKYYFIGVLWSLDALDWVKGQKGEILIRHVFNRVMPGQIIIFHQGIDPADLRAIILGLRQQGFKIVPLKVLLKNSRMAYP